MKKEWRNFDVLNAQILNSYWERFSMREMQITATFILVLKLYAAEVFRQNNFFAVEQHFFAHNELSTNFLSKFLVQLRY